MYNETLLTSPNADPIILRPEFADAYHHLVDMTMELKGVMVIAFVITFILMFFMVWWWNKRLTIMEEDMEVLYRMKKQNFIDEEEEEEEAFADKLIKETEEEKPKPKKKEEKERFETVYMPELLGIRDNKSGEVLWLHESRKLEDKLGETQAKAQLRNEIWLLRQNVGI